MALIDWFIGGEHTAEDELMRPMPGEDADLETHVDVCARRYKTLKESMLHVVRGQRILFFVMFLVVMFEDRLWDVIGYLI